METFLLTHEAQIRQYALYFTWSAILLWESIIPAKALVDPILSRWTSNVLLAVLNTVLARFLLPIVGVMAATQVALRDGGLLNALTLPAWTNILLGLLALDAAAYLLHRLLHHFPLLWRVHAVHHCDRDFDCTTGLRFHPIESLIVTVVRVAVVMAMGVPVIAVVLYEIVAIVVTFFTHANARLPSWLESPVRTLFVTPDMHRIHHSALPKEGMTNFSVVFSFWDRLGKTYLEQPAVGQKNMTVGLPWFNKKPGMNILHLMILPLISGPFRAESEKTQAQPE